MLGNNKKKAKQYQMQWSTFCYALWYSPTNRKVFLPAFLPPLFLISWKQYLKAQTQFFFLFFDKNFCLGDVVCHDVKHITPACITIADAKICYSKYLVSQIFSFSQLNEQRLEKQDKFLFPEIFWILTDWAITTVVLNLLLNHNKRKRKKKKRERRTYDPLRYNHYANDYLY